MKWRRLVRISIVSSRRRAGSDASAYVYNAVYVDGNGLLEEEANLAGELVGSAHAFFHGEVYRKRSGPAE